MRYIFYAFIVSVPIEAAHFGPFTETASLSKALGLLFFAAAAIMPRRVFDRPRPAVVWSFLYLSTFVILGVVMSHGAQGVWSRAFQLAQLVVLLWLASNILKDDQVYHGTLVALLIGCTALALIQYALPRTLDQYGAGRVSALAENPNTVGSVLAIGVICALAVAGDRRKRSALRIMALLPTPLLVSQIIATGSRGALAALAIGLMTFVIAMPGERRRVRAIILVIMVVVGAAYSAHAAADLRARWRAALVERNFGNRELIFPAALDMYLERPIIGWGPETHLIELGSRFGVDLLEEHNLYLWLANEGGLLTLIPMMISLLFAFLAAVRARRGHRGTTPLALFMLLLAMNMSGVFQNRKIHWLIMAIAISSAPRISRLRVQRNPAMAMRLYRRNLRVRVPHRNVGGERG